MYVCICQKETAVMSYQYFNKYWVIKQALLWPIGVKKTVIFVAQPLVETPANSHQLFCIHDTHIYTHRKMCTHETMCVSWNFCWVNVDCVCELKKTTSFVTVNHCHHQNVKLIQNATLYIIRIVNV